MTATREGSYRFESFDAEKPISSSSSVSSICASLADVRWMPHSSVTISYSRGDFTAAEKEAFHRAIESWQRALAGIDTAIVVNEGAEVQRDAQPTRSQIIVKRDGAMDSHHFGKSVAWARPDNYIERATILINGSLHKQSSLRKTLLHELGHGFGLRDCPDCQSGTTVMNYFSQLSFAGFTFHKAGGKIPDRPTACDIAQVAAGYREGPRLVDNAEPGTGEMKVVVADQMVNTTASVGDGEDNIIAPYLSRTSAGTDSGMSANTRPAIAHFNLSRPISYTKSSTHLTQLLLTSYLKPEFKAIDLFTSDPNARPSAQNETQALLSGRDIKFAPPIKPLINPAVLVRLSPLPESVTSAEGRTVNPVSLARSASEESGLVMPTGVKTKFAEIRPLNDRERAGHEHVLTDMERASFESYVPTLLSLEAETMNQLNNYTFRREIIIQTIDSKGRVSGEYRRVSDLVFDDSGARIERSLSESKSTLRRLKITPEYLEDFSGAQLKGFELSKRDHYRIEPYMADTSDGVSTRVYRITPLNLNAERATQARVFYGFAWVDVRTGKIIKIKGCALPDDKQRYPLFETRRELIDGVHLFPVTTIGDDYLVYPSYSIHVRMLITYSNYKRFASTVKITEIAESGP